LSQPDLMSENQRLRKELDALRSSMDNIGAYVFTKDIQGHYTYVNEHVRALFNLPYTEIMGKTDKAFFDLERYEDIVANDQQVLELGKTLEIEEPAVIRHNGKTRYYWTVKHPTYDENGNIIGLYGLSIDITDRKLLEQELQQKEALLDTVLNNVDAFVYMKDSSYRFLYVNEKTAQLFSCQREQILGKTDKELHPKANDFNAMDKQVVETGKAVTGEEEFTDEQQRTHYYWSNKVPLKDEQGKVTSYIGFSHDITELICLKRELEKRATTDDLTLLANRRKCLEQANHELKRSKRTQQDFCLMILDLDHFKRVNDTYGHAMGDKVLFQVAQTFQKNIRETDLAGRLGGEEFFILLPDTKLDEAWTLAERIRKAVESINMAQNGDCFSITTCIGLTQVNHKEQSISDMLLRADDALYLAKNNGRNRVETA